MVHIYVKVFVCLVFGICVLSKDIDKDCDLQSIPSGCPRNEACTPDRNNYSVGKCKCAAGLKRNDSGVCTFDPAFTTVSPQVVTAAPRISPSDTGHDSISSGSSVAAGILIPLVVVAFLVSMVFLARRYRWLQRLRQLRARHYDEMQIGQEDDDDPPIA